MNNRIIDNQFKQKTPTLQVVSFQLVENRLYETVEKWLKQDRLYKNKNTFNTVYQRYDWAKK